MSENLSAVSAIVPPRSPGVAPSLVRASHADREAAAARLQAALGEGRLELDETEARLGTVYGSRYRSDLLELLADLPAPEPPGLRAGWARVWQVIIRQVWISSAPVRGIPPADPSPTQQRATTVVLVTALLWALLCLLIGFSVGLLG